MNTNTFLPFRTVKSGTGTTEWGTGTGFDTRTGTGGDTGTGTRTGNGTGTVATGTDGTRTRDVDEKVGELDPDAERDSQSERAINVRGGDKEIV